MIRNARAPLPRLPFARLPFLGLLAGGLVLAALAGHVHPAGAEELAAQAEAGRGALRPYVHVLAAYGIAWALVCGWTWRIARGLKRVEEGLERDAGTRG